MAPSISKEFNNILGEFMQKMIITFPEQKKLRSYHRAFRASKLYNSLLPVQIFMGGCVNFSDQIRNRDENFFKKRDTFIESAKTCSNFGTDTGIVDEWESLTILTRNSIWEYIQTLFVMGEIIVNKDEKLRRQIDIVYQTISIDEMIRFEDNSTTDFSTDFLTKINSN